MQKDTHPKISESIKIQLLDPRQKLPFYGYLNLTVNYHDYSEKIPTCGVNVTSGGLNFYYNTDFLNNLTQEEVNFIVLHEDFHLLWDHQLRTGTKFDKKLANIAQDMIINYIILEDINPEFAKMPVYKEGKLSGELMGYLPPKEYTGNLVFEELYHFLLSESEGDQSRDVDNGGGDDWGDNSRTPSGIVRGPSLNKILSEDFDNSTDVHMSDDVPPELKRAILDGIKESIKSRGYMSGDTEGTLAKLSNPKKDYLSELRRYYLTNISGTNKSKTIRIPSRRGIPGVKGIKRNKSIINVILDVSGSMSGQFETVLSYINTDGVEINLIKADTQVKGVEVLRNKKQIQNIEIKGLGGTRLQPALDLVIEKYNKYPSVILTDGICDSLDSSGYRMPILILTTQERVKISGNKSVKQFNI